METTWYPHGNQVVPTEKPCGVNVVTTLCPHVYKNHMVSKYHVETMLFSCWHHMVSRCIPHGLHVDSMWFPCGPHVVSRWIPHHFQTTSVANWSRKLTNLWKPVTSLIMVRFSIRKKFWKALGLLYQLVLMSFPHKWKWPHRFPFDQISLQSHVTTLNQPIRSLNSLKSPSSRRHFCDFVRFHPKFHPHLKSKAVRTALLKMNKKGIMADDIYLWERIFPVVNSNGGHIIKWQRISPSVSFSEVDIIIILKKSMAI